ncbi:MAG: 2,3-bisphosphoglycerate-independent phosphoglycerate mutase, partial [Candidatus Oxydemutatoraceae bacterium WSBS_2016_MAG_OTU14]
MKQASALKGKRTALVIIDGLGIAPDSKPNNALTLANTPNLDKLFKTCPHTLLSASGSAIGLPPGQIGNSEVGHTAMGCGYVIEQDIARINSAIEDGSFFRNPTLNKSLEKAARDKRAVHLVGLVSDGGVHAHIYHLQALIELCKKHGAVPLLHMMTDGRDTGPRDAQKFIHQIEPFLQSAHGSIATVMGRYYGMDRDHRWDRTELAWKAIVLAQGKKFDSASDVVQTAYSQNIGDEFIPPAVLPTAQPLLADDQMILFNYRNDRPRQLLYALAQESFKEFARGQDAVVLNQVTTITEIDKRLKLSCLIVF